MAGLTRGLVSQHGAGRADTYGVALLDIAQDHLLFLLASLGLFDDGAIAFKGGTSLRKCRLGNAGRFSTDLDFAAPDDDKVLAVCDAIDGAAVGGFRFGLESTRGDGRHWRLIVEHDELGAPDIGASVEFARRPLVLSAEHLGFIPLRVQRFYGFDLPTLPVIAEPEACAEKLARFRRVRLGRDLYDLNQFAGRRIDEKLVRRLWVLKVWADVVDDGRGHPPLDAEDVLGPRPSRELTTESIGKLTQPVDLAAWMARVRERFPFLADLDADEQRWAACNERHRAEVEAAIVALSVRA